MGNSLKVMVHEVSNNFFFNYYIKFACHKANMPIEWLVMDCFIDDFKSPTCFYVHESKDSAYYGFSPLRDLKVFTGCQFFSKTRKNTRKISRNKFNGHFMFSTQNTRYSLFRDKMLPTLKRNLGEAGSVAVLPRRYAPMARVRFPVLAPYCAFGFQSILASAGFLRVLRFSLLHLKLDFLNKSVSMHFMEASLKFNAFALLGFAWFPPNVINKLSSTNLNF